MTWNNLIGTRYNRHSCESRNPLAMGLRVKPAMTTRSTPRTPYPVPRTRFVKRTCLFFLGIFATTLISCYSFHGASIPPNIRTFSVDMFQNRATMVNPVLSLEVTDGLIDHITSRSNLVQTTGGGDIEISGEITAYTLTPMAAQADAQAALQRFTISIRVNFANNVTPADSFSQGFTVSRDFDSSIDFASVEEELMREIVEQLVNDVFMRAFANW